jgi:hypothetical protein
VAVPSFAWIICLRIAMPVQIYKRVNLSRQTEEYQLWGEFDREPDGAKITKCLQDKVPFLLRGKVAEPELPSANGKWW